MQHRFWASATPRLRAAHQQMVGLVPALRPNTDPDATRRPLVLVVEDQAAVARLAVRAVELLGYGAIAAADGPTGLALAEEYHPDLVVTDALLPGLDGRELCRHLKQQPHPPKVIVISGVYTSTRHVTEGRSVYRADEYLAKPFGFVQFQDLLRRHLSGIDRRTADRFPAHVTVVLERHDENIWGETSEITVTDNLGRGGACIRTALPISPNELVSLRQVGGRFRAQAVVKHVSMHADGHPRLHLSFRTVVGLLDVLPGSPT